MKQMIFMVLGAVVLTGCVDRDDRSPVAAQSHPAQQTAVRTVSVAQFAAALRNTDAVVLDVRTPQEFATGRLRADARNINFYDADFRAQLAQLDKTKTYLIYCRSGNRSGKARAMMRAMGFRDVVELDGGVNAWLRSGKELVK